MTATRTTTKVIYVYSGIAKDGQFCAGHIADDPRIRSQDDARQFAESYLKLSHVHIHTRTITWESKGFAESGRYLHHRPE